MIKRTKLVIAYFASVWAYLYDSDLAVILLSTRASCVCDPGLMDLSRLEHELATW